MALPPIVRADTIAVDSSDIIKKFIFNTLLKLVDMATQQAPDITPHISPMTSLQKLDTLSVFFLNVTASFAPFTFLEAMELKTLKLDAVTETPIMSKIIPKAMKNNTNIIPKKAGILGSKLSDVKDINKDNVKAIITILIIQL